MPNLDTFAFTMAGDLLECLCAQLALTVGGPVCRCCLSPGPAPADSCCDCGDGQGQAWVRVTRMFPSGQSFPGQDSTVQNCAGLSSWAVELELGAYRCAATLDDDGQPPACGLVTADVETILDDAAAMRSALRCCFAPTRDLVAGQWQPIGPSGACMGGSMTVIVQAYDCPCP